MRLQERRRLEDRAIQVLARSHASLIRFKPKPDASLCTMQFEMLQHGSRPLKLKPPTPARGGRRFEAYVRLKMHLHRLCQFAELVPTEVLHKSARVKPLSKK